jgi:uncharacterized protein YdaU (DUF1376 family)
MRPKTNAGRIILMQSYRFNINDYLAASARLTIHEDLCYRRLLDLYYETEKPLDIEVEKVARAIGYQSHVKTVIYILDNFFVLTGTGYRNKRCDAELEAYRAKSEKASKAGKASVIKRRLNKGSTSVELALNVRSSDKPKSKGLSASDMPQVETDMAEAFIKHRKAVKAPLTMIAWQAILKECAKSGWEPSEAITECLTRGWKSFKAEWVKPKREAQQAQYEANVFSTDFIDGECYESE